MTPTARRIGVLVAAFVLLALGVRWDDVEPPLVVAAALLGGGLLALASAWDRP